MARSDATRVPTVLLLTAPSDGADLVEQARTFSLWRALCQVSHVRRAAADSGFEAFSEGMAAVICAEGATVERNLLPSDCRIIGVPTRAGAVCTDADEIWVRHSDEEHFHEASGKPVHLVADGFEPVSALPPDDPDAVAILTTLATAVQDVDAALSALPGRPLLVDAAVDSVLSRNSSAQVRVIDTETGALARAGSIFVPAVAVAGAGHPLLGWALMSDRTLVFETDAAPPDPDSLSGVDPDITLRHVQKALGLRLSSTAAAQGALISENLGLSVEIAHSTFLPSTRLFHAHYNVRGTIPSGALTGEIVLRAGSSGQLVNAWVQEMVAPPDIPARLRATVALRPGTPIEDVEVEILAWDRPITSFPATEGMVEETGGLIGMGIQDGKAQVTYWARDTKTPVQLGKRPVDTAPRMTAGNGVKVFEASGEFPFNRDSLSVLVPEGFSQKFTNFRAINQPRRITSRRLASMRDSYRGRIGWLIGNGPSVRTEDLDRLSDAGALCFCFNRFHLAYDTTRLRPEFTVTGDLQMIEDFGQNTVDRAGGTVFVVNERAPDIVGDYVWVRFLPIFPSLFSLDASVGVSPGGSSVYMAMQIGHYLGIRDWFVYGADFGFTFSRRRAATTAFRSVEGDSNHFIPNYRAGLAWCPPAIENILTAFHAARLRMEVDDGSIRNATHGGHLEVFDRIEFDTALRETTA